MEKVHNPDWLFERTREIQNDADGHLDLWSREHYKSTIITFGKTIQDVLRYHGEDPLPGPTEPAFCIFSHVRPIAKAFLRQIRHEFEWNQELKDLFPDILYQDPVKEAPMWSLDDGIMVRRKRTAKEASIEASGLVDGQPTSKHYEFLIYDDVVTLGSVTNPEMIEKTTEAMRMSFNLGAGEDVVKRFIGTRYHFADTYHELLKSGAVKPRIYACTEDGKIEGRPVMRSRKFIADKFKEMGPYVFSSQMLQNPTADTVQGFKREWLRFYERDPDADFKTFSAMNRYILVDPASEKKQRSDYTAIAVIGLGQDRNMYLLDAYRDRLNLAERAQLVMALHRHWRPKMVGYEKYGMMADTAYLKQIQGEDNYRFEVLELGGIASKTDRIKRLVPQFANHQFYIPYELYRTQYDGKEINVIEAFINEEFMMFPVSIHDDLLDAMSRIYDLELSWPKAPREHQKDRYEQRRVRAHSFMGI